MAEENGSRGLSQRELILEVRSDVKEIRKDLGTKADEIDVQEINKRVGTLETKQLVNEEVHRKTRKDSIAYRKWVILVALPAVAGSVISIIQAVKG